MASYYPPEIIEKIKEDLISGISQIEIAKKYNTHQCGISEIKRKYKIIPLKIFKPKKNLIGKTYGSWLVESIAPKKYLGKRNRTAYNCKCLKCNNQYVIMAESLVAKTSKQCAQCRHSELYTGFEGISGTFWQILKRNALQRKIEFKLNIKYLWNLYLKQNKKCALSGEIIILDKVYKKQTASLDRIDPSKGYIKGNVQWVTKEINFMKWTLKQTEFIQKCGQIYNYNQNKNIEYFI
jgi:hypothetical protein